ncbi:MAG: hypothetical protein AB7O57_11800 [Hyphomicrobiaceae bacterium]
MRRTLIVLVSLAVGYLVGAVAGGLLVEMLSANRHDRSLEAVMTGAFVTGPLGALLGALAGLVAARSGTGRRDPGQEGPSRQGRMERQWPSRHRVS